MKIPAFLLALIFVSILSGCSNDQYAVEKQYWGLQKQAVKIFNNPHATPPNELEAAVKKLNAFIEKYPKNNLSVAAEFNIARLYLVKEQYGKARVQLRKLADKYRKSENISSEAVFLIGNSYEMEDKWDLALEQYKKLMAEYPVSPKGFEAPIYIALHYKVKYQPDRMILAYQEAIPHYRALVAKYPDSPLAYNADNVAAQCYMALKDWQSAINSFNRIIEKYKGKVNLDHVLMNMALIYSKELNDKIKGKEILGQLVRDYPKSRLARTATALIKEWEKK